MVLLFCFSACISSAERPRPFFGTMMALMPFLVAMVGAQPLFSSQHATLMSVFDHLSETGWPYACAWHRWRFLGAQVAMPQFANDSLPRRIARDQDSLAPMATSSSCMRTRSFFVLDSRRDADFYIKVDLTGRFQLSLGYWRHWQPCTHLLRYRRFLMAGVTYCSCFCRHLYLNQLTETIPSELGQLTLLRELYVQPLILRSSFASDILWCFLVAWCVGRRLYNNQLVGTMPTELGHLTALNSLCAIHSLFLCFFFLSICFTSQILE